MNIPDRLTLGVLLFYNIKIQVTQDLYYNRCITMICITICITLYYNVFVLHCITMYLYYIVLQWFVLQSMLADIIKDIFTPVEPNARPKWQCIIITFPCIYISFFYIYHYKVMPISQSFAVSSYLIGGGWKNAENIPSRWVRLTHPTKGFQVLSLMVSFQFWRTEECGVSFHCHFS